MKKLKWAEEVDAASFDNSDHQKKAEEAELALEEFKTVISTILNMGDAELEKLCSYQ